MITVSLLDIFLIRCQDVLYIRLLSGENTEWSKYVLNVAKMWIKEIRFKSSPVYVIFVRNLKPDFSLSLG